MQILAHQLDSMVEQLQAAVAGASPDKLSPLCHNLCTGDMIWQEIYPRYVPAELPGQLARSLLAAGLIPGQKRNRVWHIEESDLPRIEQAFRLLSQAPASPSSNRPRKTAVPTVSNPISDQVAAAAGGSFLSAPNAASPSTNTT